MKKNLFAKRSTFVIYFFLTNFIVSLQAQNAVQDSLSCPAASLSQCYRNHNVHSLKLREVLIPTALAGVSALYVGNRWLASQKEEVQHALSAEGKHKIPIDHVTQFAPAAAVYGLNLFGVKGKHSFKDRTIMLAMSYATMRVLVSTMKLSLKEKRPDSDTRNSFPSGHTATAFMGAEFLYKEYKDVSPWIGYAGYAVAAATGYLRIYNNRHYFNDVIAGACIGIASTKLTYWLYPKCFKKSQCNKPINITGCPFYSKEASGMNICIVF